MRRSHSHRRRCQPLCRSPKKNFFVSPHRRYITHRARCRDIVRVCKGRPIVRRVVVQKLRGSRLSRPSRQCRRPRRLRELAVHPVIVDQGLLSRFANERMRHGNRTVVGPKEQGGGKALVGIRRHLWGGGTCGDETWVVVAPQGQMLQHPSCPRLTRRQVLEPTGLTGRQDEIRGESW